MFGSSADHLNTLFIDTNLLLLLVVGLLDPRQIETFKRTRAYTREDFSLLLTIVSQYDGRLLTTPSILTEVSNLTGNLSEPLRSRGFIVLAGLTKQITEEYHRSAEIVEHPYFTRLGLADVSVLLASRERVTVLTDDLDLYLRLSSEGVSVFNFNHIRSGAWG